MIEVDGNSFYSINRRMLSFPSAFDRGGSRLKVDGINPENRALIQKYNMFFQDQNGNNQSFDNIKSKIPTIDLSGHEDNSTLYSLVFNEDNIAGVNYNFYTKSKRINEITGNIAATTNDGWHINNNTHYYENPYHFPVEVLRSMNTYRSKHKYKTKVPLDDFIAVDDGENGKKEVSQRTKSRVKTWLNIDTTSSMFNPNYSVQVLGFSPNVPLLSDIQRDENIYKTAEKGNSANDLSDCSIRKLVALSNTGQLGSAIYRFADFMYCKDLGKVSNNYLITLRKFNLPVGDHISFMSNRSHRPKNKKERGYEGSPEVGHLVTWFGTDDNKIEDILKYSYQYTWKELQSKRQDLDSQEDDQSRGVIGMISNSFSPAYNSMSNSGLAGTHSLWSSTLFPGSLLSKMTFGIVDGSQVAAGTNLNALRQYDQNKVYAPQQTIRDMHIPDGQLKFNHEFTLNFSYRLREYENINQKSAFLDLLNNILKVTYFDGRFWGGSKNIIGPKPNPAGYRRANAMINKAFNKVGGFISSLADGSLDFQDILGSISSLASSLYDKAKATAQNLFQNISGNDWKTNVSNFLGWSADRLMAINAKTGISDGIKGALKNALGRPAFYAFDSLLSGDDTGLWHVTIGNPRNPIVSMGNLIMTNASVQHAGPLGIDDFPTELKVTVSLKHARSRDARAIGRMYTSGLKSLSFSQQNNSYTETRDELNQFNDPDETKNYGIDTWEQEPVVARVYNSASQSSNGQDSSGSSEATAKPDGTENMYSKQGESFDTYETNMYAYRDEIKTNLKGYDVDTDVDLPEFFGNGNSFAANYKRMMFHNGSDNVTAIMTMADQDLS